MKQIWYQNEMEYRARSSVEMGLQMGRMMEWVREWPKWEKNCIKNMQKKNKKSNKIEMKRSRRYRKRERKSCYMKYATTTRPPLMTSRKRLPEPKNGNRPDKSTCNKTPAPHMSHPFPKYPLDITSGGWYWVQPMRPCSCVVFEIWLIMKRVPYYKLRPI